MNIGVISPHIHGNGNTTIASLLAFELASRNRTVCLTHTRTKSESMFHYFGFKETDDRTSNPVQIINLIREGGIQKQDVKNYCRQVTDRLDLFSLDAFIAKPGKESGVSSEQMDIVTRFIATSFPYDYIVFDVDENSLDNSAVRITLEYADVLVFVISQSITELKRFAAEKTKILKQTGNIPSLVVVNRYCDLIGTIKNTAGVLGIRNPKSWYPVRLNQWVPYCENRGELKYLAERIQNRDARVLELDYDIKKLAGGIQNVKQAARNHRREQIRGERVD